MWIVTEQDLTDAEILKRSSLKLPKNLSGLSRTDAQAALAPYLVQGMDPASAQIRAEFHAEADAIADRAGAASMGDLVGRMLTEKKVTTEALQEHPEWVLLIGRYGDAAQIRHLKLIESRLDRSSWIGGSRLRNRLLGHLIDEAMALSGQMEAAMYGSSKVRNEWIWRYIFGSPYHSCIPDGALIGPDGKGSVPTSLGPMKLSITPEFRLRYTDPKSGKKKAREPEFLYGRPEDRECLSALAELRRYVTMLQSDLRGLLDSMYLLGDAIAATCLPRIAADPLLASFFKYVVFRQVNTDFMLITDGFVTADGVDYTPMPYELVSVPHPLAMHDDALAAFRAMPKQRYANVTQLREPIYDVTDLPERMFVDVDQDEAKVFKEAEKDFLLVREFYLPQGVWSVCRKYLEPSPRNRYHKVNKWYIIPVHTEGPLANHILYKLDLQSAASRIKLDDMQLMPLLRLNNPKRALQRAIKAGAVKLTAALLEEVSEGRKKHNEVNDFRL